MKKMYRVFSFCSDHGPLDYGSVEAPNNGASIHEASDPNRDRKPIQMEEAGDLASLLEKIVELKDELDQLRRKGLVVHIWVTSRSVS